ncbi:protein ACCELERATED CELL DEATH 6-like [Tripterygium wilfordii]|nr:protein ACCELERATED CELL DEATH 6-like [Tripterygium wilfordii]
MGYVELNMEDSNRGRWNPRIEYLKETVFPTTTSWAIETMEPTLYEAVVAGDIDGFIERLERFVGEKQLAAIVILEQPSLIGNTLLHVAADSSNVEITQLLAHHFPSLLTKRNEQGDTALHLAARAKMPKTVKVLVNIAKTLPPPSSDDDAFLRMKNEKGNTALHEAVMQESQEVAASFPLPEAMMQESQEVAYCLLQADYEAAYCVNNDGKSPLYVAAELRNTNILTRLLEDEIAADGHPVAVLEKLRGEKSPVDAALLHKNSDMLIEIASKTPELLHSIEKEGKSPIHYAASIGYVEGVKFILEKKQGSALVRDNNGFYPIHEACKNGHVQVVMLLLERWFDPREFLTREGKNIFHVAAERGEDSVVKYLLRAPRLAKFVAQPVNQQDKEGNTPLHLATLHARSRVVFGLVRHDNIVNVRMKNGANLTAYDLAVEKSRIAAMWSSEKPKLEAKVKLASY